MVSPVVGWTIGQATCLRSKQEGFAYGQSFLGQYISGELAHTHSVRKLMASCNIMLLCLTPPSIRMKHTLGRRVGVGIVVACCIRGDQRGVGAGVTGARHLCTPQVIWGTPMGTLFLVTRECVCLVSLNILFVVGLGAAL